VRVRTSGSAGGHNGVRSLIAAFGTNDLRRVKIGIGRPGRPGEDRDRVSDHVLSPFFPEEQEAIAAACDGAADEALRLVERR
jgi:PTH1 family peptidyl-tRNA hydrolase